MILLGIVGGLVTLGLIAWARRHPAPLRVSENWLDAHLRERRES